MTEPTKVGLPAEAGAQQQVSVAGQQFEDLDEIDRQRERDRADGVVEQPLQIGLDQRALAELRQRFLLLDAAAQFRFEIETFGDVVAEPEHALGHPVLHSDRSARFQPALLVTVSFG